MSVCEFFIYYIELVFWFLSEVYLLIFLVINGCFWNKCGFCEMYIQL